MGWLSLGFMGEEAAAPPAVHPAVANYKACRSTRPVEDTPGALSPQDPCWTQLVALRRYQGRDPLGRDVYGVGGPKLPRDVAFRPLRYEEIERTGVMPVAPSQEKPLQVVVVQRREQLRQKARDLEDTRDAVEERRRRRWEGNGAPKSYVKEWQVAAAALVIGVTLGRLFGKRRS